MGIETTFCFRDIYYNQTNRKNGKIPLSGAVVSKPVSSCTSKRLDTRESLWDLFLSSEGRFIEPKEAHISLSNEQGAASGVRFCDTRVKL